MNRLFRFLLVVATSFTFPLLAEAPGVVSFGYGLSTLEEVKPAAIADLDKGQHYQFGFDIGSPIAFYFGFKHLNDRSTNINFDNAGIKRGEIYYSTVDMGLKFFLPLGPLRPFFGGGGSLGFLAVSDPTNRKAHGFTAAFGRETSGIRALWANAGLDIKLQPEWGFRAEGRYDMVETNRYGNLESKAVEFRATAFIVSLIFGPGK